MKYGKIAKMGRAADKQDKFNSEFEKGENVTVKLPINQEVLSGVVVKDKGEIVIVDVAGTRYEFKSIFVSHAE